MRFVITAAGFNLNYFEFTRDASVVLPGVQPTGYALHPSYPNPFNPVTTISYDLPVPGTVTLTVYDVAGKRVRTLVAAESLEAGRHQAVWNGRDDTGRFAPAGVYFYRLDADAYSQTRTMSLVK
jgi:hypothetical protein